MVGRKVGRRVGGMIRRKVRRKVKRKFRRKIRKKVRVRVRISFCHVTLISNVYANKFSENKNKAKSDKQVWIEEKRALRGRSREDWR